MRIPPRQARYDLAMRPVAWLRRYVAWPLRRLRWWDWIDEWVLVGGRIHERDVTPLWEVGVGAVVNLCAELRDPIREIRSAGMRALHLPTSDLHAPSRETIARAVRFVASNAMREVRTYVHCAHGIGRSPTVAAAWLVHRGWSAENALLVVKARRPVARPNPRQVRAVLDFASGPQGTSPAVSLDEVLLDSGDFVPEGGIA